MILSVIILPCELRPAARECRFGCNKLFQRFRRDPPAGASGLTASGHDKAEEAGVFVDSQRAAHRPKAGLTVQHLHAVARPEDLC